MTGYRVYRSGPDDSDDPDLVYAGPELSFTDTGLANGRLYIHRVSGVNAVGEGELSGIASIPVGPPRAPELWEATAGDRAVTLGWSPPGFDGFDYPDGGREITAYRVYREGGGLPRAHVATVDAADGAFGNYEYTDSTVASGNDYRYAVTAVNELGEGPPSEELEATPFGAPGRVQTPPTGLVDSRPPVPEPAVSSESPRPPRPSRTG
jgi:hypothetical protein